MGNSVTINTDASFKRELQTGGYGVWLKSDLFTIKGYGKFKGCIVDANEAEIKGVINAFWVLEQQGIKFDTVIVNCDNNVVKNIINKRIVRERFKKEGNALLEYVRKYRKVYAKNIKGHKSGHNARQWVNNWCDNASKTYLRKKLEAGFYYLD